MFRKKGLFKEDSFFNGTVNFNNSSISVMLNYKTDSLKDSFMLLSYNTTYRGETKSMDYMVRFTSIPSNLGKGNILYFVCPISKKRCKVLYMAYGSSYFKSLSAYKNRIYYDIQKSSKQDLYNAKYWVLEYSTKRKQLNHKLSQKHAKCQYNGKPTKWKQELDNLEDQLKYYDYKRIQALMSKLKK